ncbi:hypothetical protein E0L36_21520 [Streptomyces sp. AJS327]|nr:hypothetical protein [Streptomyces sp. AJS327]
MEPTNPDAYSAPSHAAWPATAIPGQPGAHLRTDRHACLPISVALVDVEPGGAAGRARAAPRGSGAAVALSVSVG